MKFKGSLSVLLVGAALSASGCATVAGGGSSQILNIDSNPKGASIFVGNTGKNGEIINLSDSGKVTPSQITLSRKDGVVVVKKAGFKDATVQMNKKLNPWFWGNVALGSLLSTSIDASTGAIKMYDKDAYFVEMQAN
jgi:hypothetical protein